VGKYQIIGLGLLLVVTFVMVDSAYGLYTVDIDDTNGELKELDFSTIDAVQSRFQNTIFENSTNTMHVVWFDDTTPDDLVTYSNTQDGGLTKSTPIIIYTGGGGGFPQVVSAEVAVSGNNVFINWVIDEDGLGNFSILEKTSVDNGATFSVQWTVFANATGISGANIEMVGNSASDIAIIYRNATSNTLEARISHNNGVTWSFETLAGANHGAGNADGIPRFGDSSLTMIGDTIDIAFGAEYTGGAPCDPVTCDSVFHQQSTDAGDTWLTDPLLLNDGLTDHTTERPFLFVSGSTINVFYEDDAQTGQIQQARSINGGTSFTQQINTGITGGNCVGGFPYQDWFVVGADSNLAIFCEDGVIPELDFVSSSNTGSTWSSIGSVSTTNTPENFQGYTNGTDAVVGFSLNVGNAEQVIFSTDGLTTWSARSDPFTDSNNVGFNRDGLFGFTDSRAILIFDDFSGTSEVGTYSFRFPVECDPTANQNFTCPLDMSALTAGNSTFPSNMAGVGTTNGFFATWNQDVSGNERIMFGSTTDGITATTPIILSGIATTGQDEDQLFIFEDGGTLGSNIIDVFWRELDPIDANSDLHTKRSTDGGATFGSLNQIEDMVKAFYPIVDGSTIYKFWTDDDVSDVLFGRSDNGGTSFTADTSLIPTSGDTCDNPSSPIKAIKDSGGTLHFVYHGENATGSASICYTRSTDNGASWNLTGTVIGSDVSTSVTLPFAHELEIFDDGSNTTVLWKNANDDEILQARSTNNGGGFGSVETVLLTAGQDCTDPSRLAVITNVGTNIYVACQSSANNGIDYLVSNNMGLTYSTQAIMITNPSAFGTFEIDETQGFSTTGRTYFLTNGDQGSGIATNALGFTDDDGVSFDDSNRTPNGLFFSNEPIKVLTGNSTHLWAGFVRNNNGDPSQNAWVSLATITGAVPPNNPPVVTILGDNPLQHLLDTTYTDAGATCSDTEDGDLTSSIVTVNSVNSAVLGSYTVIYTCTDSGSLFDQEIRNVTVVAEITTTTTTGGGAPSGGAPVGDVPDVPFPQAEFDQALADALAQIEVTEATPLEVLIQTFFEFTVIDVVHDDIQLQSLLSNERLGFRWSSGNDLVLVSAITAPSPFFITFEQLPEVKQGSGFTVSTDFIVYDLEVPRNLCTNIITQNCVEKLRYEIPVTLNAIINEIQVSDTGTITVDLTEELIDPIIVILLATFAIPIVGVVIQRARGRSSFVPARRALGT